MDNNNFAKAREKMIKTQLIPRGIKDQRVIEAMQKVPRHQFVPQELVHEAYNDYPLSIGHNQTISQPYIVAFMTEALDLKGDEKVLEIGTGSGYQTAILAELCKQVYTVERIKELLENAKKRLDKMGYNNIMFKAFDGTLGWDEYKPYDAIIVTAGAPNIPYPLVEQLKEGGRLVIPIGDRFMQNLIKVTKKGKTIEQKSLGGCRFVDLIGVYGWKDKHP